MIISVWRWKIWIWYYNKLILKSSKINKSNKRSENYTIINGKTVIKNSGYENFTIYILMFKSK